MPAMMRISVLLPEPLRPSMPRVAPAGTARLTSVRASRCAAGLALAPREPRFVSAVLSVVYPVRRTTF
jgi:hypothetical protein